MLRGGGSGFARSADGSVLVYTRHCAKQPPALFAARRDGSAERQIESLNRAQLTRHALGEVRELTIKGWHGDPIQMLVVYPPNFDPPQSGR